MAAPNFDLVTPLELLVRRDFAPVDALWADMDPDDANPVLDGEFLQINADYQLTRAVAVADAAADGSDTGANAATIPNFAMYAERGRYDTRSIRKLPVLFSAGYEADTAVFRDDDDFAPSAIGAPLYVFPVAVAGSSHAGVKRGLGAEPTALVDGALVHGYVTRLPAANGGRLRFVCVVP